MQNLFKFMFFIPIFKYSLPQEGSVKVAIAGDAGFSEDLLDLIEGWFSRFDQFSGKEVSINDRCTERVEYGGDRGFPTTDSAGKSHDQRVLVAIVQ